MLHALDALWIRECAGCDRTGPRLCHVCAADLALREVAVEGLPCVALATYDAGVARALRRAKYGRDRVLMRELAAHVAAVAGPFASRFDAVVPVPSPWTRRVARGFAPGAVLADAIGSASGVPVRHAVAMRPGDRQAALGAERRRENLRGRLRSVAPVPGRVLLVDDVVTTGSTLAGCARELLGDATSSVTGLALCATPLSRDRGQP